MEVEEDSGKGLQYCKLMTQFRKGGSGLREWESRES